MTNERVPNYWNWYTDNRYWYGMPGRGQNPGPAIPTKGKGSFDKWGSRNPVGKAPMTEPVGKVYQDSDVALKTNGRSLAKTCLY